MQLTPSQAFEHTKEAIIEYLETAYKIAHSSVFAERGEMLRQRGIVAQAPFIEATPAFPTGRKLVELERVYPDLFPKGLADLVQYGIPVDRFALYQHQEQALLAAFSESPHLLVATGTGSGKTESFLLPVLADILREAQSWASPHEQAKPGLYDEEQKVWLHSRCHEARPSALRCIILYPMNALVNDQLSRLRRILARGTSPEWQRQHLQGNVIHFGMYTGITQPTGDWREKRRRNRYHRYIEQVHEDWEKLREELRETGSWPRPDGPEMLCRWDMQAAPPDILVTNYSMLEYMLARPVEYPIFEKTRQWLANTVDGRFTLVLDEAHTYTGAKGTEVAYLVRRLKERLGIDVRSTRFRAIATSASIPNTPGADNRLLQFTSDLFGEPADRFSIIRVAGPSLQTKGRPPTLQLLQAFSQFHETFDIQNPLPAITDLAYHLHLSPIDPAEHPQVTLHALLKENLDVTWVRQRTARNATLLDQLAHECWGNVGTSEGREKAIAGILAAGSFARPIASTDIPPLLSMRIHAFFRGITGIWACIDPHCSEVQERFRVSDNPRPLGKLYMEPRPWCACGARVLELFSCRHCGLLFLGGIPDSSYQSLWPWSDDLSGERQDLKQFRIFGVEAPFIGATPEYRSTRTTLPIHPNDVYARPTYEIEPAKEGEKEIGPFPTQCPRCQKYRAFDNGREVIEPLRTKGPRSFSVIAEDGFRVQPRATKGQLPNYGRKALLFTDSRIEAAQLAADLRSDHHNDLFRQLVYRVFNSCTICEGHGIVHRRGPYIIGEKPQEHYEDCSGCQGTGRAQIITPLSFNELCSRVIELQLARGINPKGSEIRDFFARLDEGEPSCYEQAEWAFYAQLRRELAEDTFALEPLGLACWRIRLPEQTGAFPLFSEEETKLFLQAITRILATENILLPPNPYKPWEWPADLVEAYYRGVLIRGSKRIDEANRTAIPYNLTPRRKLGRYIIALSRKLIALGRLANTSAAEKWVNDLYEPLWMALNEFGILQGAGAKINNQVPRGIRIDSFELHPIGDFVHQCKSCAYVMRDGLFQVCLRCGQKTSVVSPEEINNFYRRSILYGLPGSRFDDPYPLRAIEHSAQIAGHEARDIERWFQDLYHDDQHPHDHRIDVLSVTTTMEMGIDIGSLLCVGLRNVPPTVANYQQRAGRAGRRGSSVATVLTYAQQRSHDQYYFNHPPEIVSNPPRVPTLYLNNEVIAQRHVRSLVLQEFFYRLFRHQPPRSLFEAWGTVGDCIRLNAPNRLKQFLATNLAPIEARCRKIVHPSFLPKLRVWIQAIGDELQRTVDRCNEKDSLLEQLISVGLLPKYAFPVDVVSLSIPRSTEASEDTSQPYETMDHETMQRDLKIALAEYAPGAEVIRGNFPHTYIYRSAGVYDPFATVPNYHHTGQLVECSDCQAVDSIDKDESTPLQCKECQSVNVVALPYLRPNGFTVDAAQPDAGRELYKGGGRERAGFTIPARLLVGQTAFSAGECQAPFAPNLYTYVRTGELFCCNKGPNRDFPGFIICPDCGRALDEDTPGSHTYPADIPPHIGRNRGPRAGHRCQNTMEFDNQVILGYTFHSEVILFGVDLSDTLDAPFNEQSGKAVWYSFGTLLANAATLVLQIDPGEIQVGVRPVKRAPGRIHGEVFLYDNVPGGAGYARAIQYNLQEILEKALELGEQCFNPYCSGACYHCMYDYRNQALHPVLQRQLGTAVLAYLLRGCLPTLDLTQVKLLIDAFAQYMQIGWKMQMNVTKGGHYFPCVLTHTRGNDIGVFPVHPLQARPTVNERQAILSQYGIRCLVATTFDLERRPFWVMNMVSAL